MLLSFNFLYSFETILYELQQKVTFLLMSTTSSLQLNTCLLFIFAGILTILNPCFLSLFPLSISYFNTYTKQIDKNIFIFGLITSIFFSILVTNFIGYNSFIYITRVPFLSLGIIVFLSLNLLQIFNLSYYLNFFSFNKIFNFNEKIDLIECYLTGFIIGLTIVPCNTPIFTMIHFWLYNCHEKVFLFIYLCVYFLSCVVFFLLIFYLLIYYLKTYIFAYLSNIIVPFFGFLTLTTSLFFLLEKIFL